MSLLSFGKVPFTELFVFLKFLLNVMQTIIFEYEKFSQKCWNNSKTLNTYFQNVFLERNLLNDKAKISKPISKLKRKIIAMRRPEKYSIYGIKEIVGVRCLSKLQLSFSALNKHRFRHNFICLNSI